MATEATIWIKAKDATAKAFKSAEAGLKKVGDVAGSVQVQIAGLVGAAGMGALIQMNLATAASAKKMSDAIGVNVEDLTAWQFAVRDTTVSGEKMGDIFKDMGEKIGDAFASGGGEAMDVLKRLNLDINEMVRLTPDQQLLKIAGALDQVGNHNEKIFLLESLASDASLLLPLLEDDAAGFKKAREEAEQLGAIINNETAKAAKQFQDDLEKLKATGNSLALDLGNKALPAFNNITGAMLQAAKDSGVLMSLWVGLGGAAVELLGLEGSHADAMEKAADAAAKKKRQLQELQAALTSSTTNMEESEKRVTGLREQIQQLNELGYGPTTIQGKVVAEQLKVEEENYKKAADAVKQYTAELNAKTAAQNQPAAPAASPTAPSSNGPSAEDIKRQEELQKLRDTQQAKYAQMIEGFAGEMELTYIHEAEKRAFLDESLKSEAISAQQHQTALLLIEQEGAEKRQQIAEQERKARIDIAANMMGNLSALMSSDSKSQFELGKRAAIASALIKGYEAVSGAYAAGNLVGGPILGAAYATTAAIASAAYVNSIRKQQFAGGGSISPAGGGGISTGGGQPPVAPVPPALSAQQQPQQTQSITVVFNNANVVGNDGMQQLTEQYIYPALQDLTQNRDFPPIGG